MLYENREMTEDVMRGKNEDYFILKMYKENLTLPSSKIVP